MQVHVLITTLQCNKAMPYLPRVNEICSINNTLVHKLVWTDKVLCFSDDMMIDISPAYYNIDRSWPTTAVSKHRTHKNIRGCIDRYNIFFWKLRGLWSHNSSIPFAAGWFYYRLDTFIVVSLHSIGHRGTFYCYPGIFIHKILSLYWLMIAFQRNRNNCPHKYQME